MTYSKYHSLGADSQYSIHRCPSAYSLMHYAVWLLSVSQPHHQLREQVGVIVLDVEGRKLHRAVAVGYRHDPDHLKG